MPASIRGVNSTEPRTAAPLPPVALTPDEAAAVTLALAARPAGLGAVEQAALEKVLEALEPDPVRRATLLSTSRQVSAEAGRAEELRSLLERAVTAGRVLALRYRDGRGRITRRDVEPQLVVRSSEHWLLVAWCQERQALRWFRADRIQEADLTDRPAPRRDLTGLGAPPAGGAPTGRTPTGRTPTGRHPAGRALRAKAAQIPAAESPERPRLVLLPGGRAGS